MQVCQVSVCENATLPNKKTDRKKKKKTDTDGLTSVTFMKI